MPYVSSELTHFVGRSKTTDAERYELLRLIVSKGVLLDPKFLNSVPIPLVWFDVVSKSGEVSRENYYPSPYFEVNRVGTVSENQLVSPEIVCFCDIPVEELAIHTAKYSRFGLGFSKDFLLALGANPVFYVARGANTTLELKSRGEHPDFFVDEENGGLLAANVPRGEYLDRLRERHFEVLENARAAFQNVADAYERGKTDPQMMRRQLVGFVDYMIASFSYLFGYMKVFDPSLPDNDPDNYYMEREWRVIGRVPFSLENVVRVLLPPEFEKRFREDFPAYSGAITTL